MSRKDGIPIYSTPGTINGIAATTSLGDIDNSYYNTIKADSDTRIKDLVIHSFGVSHDANEPVAYNVTCDDKKASVITDLGYYDDYTISNLTGSDMMLVEANHDINMLQLGSYPYYLKQRILGDKGHLSNETSARLINNLLNDHIKGIYLGHLSKENNYEESSGETSDNSRNSGQKASAGETKATGSGTISDFDAADSTVTELSTDTVTAVSGQRLLLMLQQNGSVRFEKQGISVTILPDTINTWKVAANDEIQMRIEKTAESAFSLRIFV